MPHLIVQTKLAFAHPGAEISFYGPIERETMEALQASTFAALQSSWDANASPVAVWRPSPFSPQVVQFLINLPGGWECRRTLHNVLRVCWLDVLEQYGWTVRSAWNTDKTTGFPPPEASAELRPHDTKEQPAADFKGECANFLLSKGDLLSKMVCGGGGVAGAIGSGLHIDTPGSSECGGERSGGEDAMPRSGGLTLPDCVQALLSEPSILRWDPVNRHYHVLDGARFEERFNQLRRVRAKHKMGAVERPFSRMHNFYVLERGDKWAKTGSLFKPKSAQFAPKGFQTFLPPLSPLSAAHAFATAATPGAGPEGLGGQLSGGGVPGHGSAVLHAHVAAAAAAAASPAGAGGGGGGGSLEFSASAIQALSVQPIPAPAPADT